MIGYPTTTTGVAASQSLSVQFFVNFVFPAGTYFRFHYLAVGLTRLGHRVTVYASDHDFRSRARKEVRDGVVYHVIPESFLIRGFGPSRDPWTAARRFVRQYPPCDVAHLFQPFPSAAAGWARSRGRVRFYDWDDLWTGGLMPDRISRWRDQWAVRVVRFLESRLPRRADHVTAVSAFLANRALEVGARDVSVIYNGFWPLAYPDREDARRRLGLRPDAVYAGFMGRTADELPWCFDALAENQDQHPTLRLAVCGAPEEYLLNLSPAVRERVDYLGQLTPEETRAFAAALDLGLLPLADNLFNQSRFPIKFSEYMATGVPLLCSTIGECGQLAGRFSWAYPAGITRAEWLVAFRDAVNRIAQDRAGTRAKSMEVGRLREEMSWDMLSHQLVAVYHSVLAKAQKMMESTTGGRRTAVGV